MVRVLQNIIKVSPISNFLMGLLYAYTYFYVYKNYIATVWEYTAFREYHVIGCGDLLIYLIMASLPFVFYKGLKYLASTFSLFVYIFVYIPFENTLFVYNFPDNVKWSYALFFFFFMIIMFLTDGVALYKKWVVGLKRNISFSVIPFITIFLFLILLGLNISQLHFVNFFEDASSMYEYRENANIKFIYVLCWLRAVFLPLLMLYYLNRSDYLKYALSFVGFVLIFMIDQQKMTIIFPFALTAIYFAIRFYNNKFYSMFHLFVIGIFIIVPLLLVKYQDNSIAMVLALIFIVRIQCIAGKQMEKYIDFFDMQGHPLTYFTHISVINQITGLYPYDMSIGEVINAGDGNSNATFFLMDGVAAAGLVGCVIIGIIFWVVKSLLNSLSFIYNVPLLSALFLFPLQSLMNVSIFTSLFSHGAILLFLILLFVDIKEFRKYQPYNISR